MKINKVRYTLTFSNGTEKQFELHMRAESLVPVGWVPSEPPQWAALEFHKCSNCPLNPDKVPFCPAALSLARLAELTRDVDLLDSVKLRVDTSGRAVAQSTTAQKAIASFVGLLMATSDCPHASYFRPIARFHLPLATEAETIYRAVTTFLLAQHFRNTNGQDVEYDLQGLNEVYQNLEVVNTALSGRLKAGASNEAVSRCMMEWDVFSGMFPLRVEELLKDMKPLFAAYLDE